MNRERALKTLLVLVGLLFTAAIYPVTMTLWDRDLPSYEGAMGLSVYFTLGILLLAAVRNPAAHRSLITFAAWSSLAHAGVMTVMVFRDVRAHEHWPGVIIFAAIGIAMIVLAPARQSPERTSTAAGYSAS
jgi:ABC-type Fe3+-siderophore transport system permease subunit